MTRYFFNIRSGSDLIADLEGVEFASVEQAREEAHASARELMAESVKSGKTVDGQIFEVTDASGELAFALPFSKALKLP